MRRRGFRHLWFGMLAVSTWGQPTAPTVDARLSFMLVGGDEAVSVQVVTGDDAARVVREVRLMPRIRSPEFRYRGPEPLHLRSRDPPGATLAEISLPGDLRRALIFLLPERGGARLQAHVMPESEARSRTEELIIFNGTTARLAAQLTGRQLFLSPGAHPPLPTTALLHATQRLFLAVETAEGWQSVADGEVQFAAGMRSYLLILPPRRADLLRVQVFSAHEPVPKDNLR